ncbi:MAG TPA: AAA family ATPase [Kofleriaceae bacterium]|nr:AAA family ATPase [Kofleriaceae bacterium]
MAAITSVEIENFRCFQKLRVEGLARVNLIVGANNSGKTAFLEAVEAVVSRESPFLLYRASLERGEFRRQRKDGEEVVELDLRHWFHGHHLTPGTTFTLRASGERELSIERTIEAVPLNAPSPPFVPAGLVLSTNRPGAPSMPTLPLTPDGLLGAGSPSKFSTFGLRLRPPVGFVTTDRLYPGELARLWTNVVLTPGEAHTIEALRLIDPAIERIAISESDGTIAKVLLRGAEGPVPLGTLGEGVSRILTLALHLVLAQGGSLLIDEIENGLHWSVMPKVWRFLVETALARDVQVFATTHSKDWLEGLADLHRTHPELAAHVSVHRLEAGRETSVRFDASRIADYVEMELEAR